jgi:hypothetical protein
MKRIALLTCFVLLSATAVSAETGALCLFSDASGSECNIVDNGELLQVYIVHTQTDGAMGAQFMLDVSAAGWTWLGDTWNYSVVVGNSVEGVSIGYGGCQTGAIALGVANLYGTSAPGDTPISIVPYPEFEHVLVVNCDAVTMLGAGGTAYVNSSLACVCETNQTPTLDVNPTSLDFGYIADTQTLTVANIGGGTLTWGLTESIPWLSLSTTSGTDNEDITVTVDRTGLSHGVYSGTIDVTSNGGNESVLVYMTVAPTEPILYVSPIGLTFIDNQSHHAMIVRNDGVNDLIWGVTSDQPWLSVSPASGTNDTQVNVYVDRTGLADGTYHGNLSVTSNGGDATVTVTLYVATPHPILVVSPGALSFGALQTEMSISVTNSGTADLTWAVASDQPWLTTNPVAGTNNAMVAVYVDRAGLAPGDYNGALTVTSDGGAAIVTVTMTVPDPSPQLIVSPGALTIFGYQTSVSLAVSNGGTEDLLWSIASDQTWLTVNPTSGVNGATVNVVVDRTGLVPGMHNANLLVTSNGGDVNVPVTVEVTAVTEEAGAICVFSDQSGTQCNIVDTGSLVQVYIIHQSTDGASGSEFRLDVGGTGWIWLGDIWNFSLVIGSSVNGVMIGYNDCLASPIALGTANFFSQAPTTGMPISIVAHPDAGGIVVADCNSNHLAGMGGTAFVNSSLPCICGTSTDPNPVLYVGPLALDFGDTDLAGAFSIANMGGGTLTWNVSESIPWLDASPTSGVNNDLITVTVDRTGLSEGAYIGVIEVTSNGGNETVVVTMDVPVLEPVLQVSPSAIAFPDGVNWNQVYVSNAGTGQLDWQVTVDQSWMSTTPTAGTNSGVVNVNAVRTGLTPGTYNGNLFVTSNGGDATVAVTLVVPVPIPVLGVSPAALSFGQSQTDLPLDVSNTGTGDLTWTITPDQTWLTATPASGTNDTQVNVHVDRTGLADGAHQGNLSVNSNGGDATVPVAIWVGPMPVLSVDPTALIYSPTVTTNTFSIANTGDGTLDWTLSADKTWIEIVPPLSGTNDATVTVNVDPASVPSGGVKVGYVAVSSNGGNQSVEIRYVPPGSDIPGAIAVFSNAGGTSCNFTDTGGLVQVHMLHIHHGGAAAAQFKLDVSSVGWTWLGDVWSYATVIGQSNTGVAIGYGGCQAAPTYLGVANFFGTAAPACKVLYIEPDPAVPSGEIEVVGCSQNKMYAQGYYGVVNPNSYCSCDGSGGTTPVQETTWGKIKAMYGTKK